MGHLQTPAAATAIAIIIASPGLAPGIAHAQSRPAPEAQASTPPPAAARPQIDQQKRQAQQQAQGAVDSDATAVISETRAALDAVKRNDRTAALAALERATGKANILLARNPASAFIPESVEVEVIETAPFDPVAIATASDAVSVAINRRDYPLARVLLDSLRSEIRVRTYSIPLATYPAALLEAARLVERGDNADAAETLIAALGTLVITDRSIPLPLLDATTAIGAADALQARDKAGAVRSLGVARAAIQRAGALGYIEIPAAAALETQIAALESQLQRGEKADAGFAKLGRDAGALSSSRAAAQSRGRPTR